MQGNMPISASNYAEKSFMKLVTGGQFHKTLFGITYTPSSMTRVVTQGNISIAA
jgi:hypothetical protein